MAFIAGLLDHDSHFILGQQDLSRASLQVTFPLQQ